MLFGKPRIDDAVEPDRLMEWAERLAQDADPSSILCGRMLIALLPSIRTTLEVEITNLARDQLTPECVARATACAVVTVFSQIVQFALIAEPRGQAHQLRFLQAIEGMCADSIQLIAEHSPRIQGANAIVATHEAPGVRQ